MNRVKKRIGIAAMFNKNEIKEYFNTFIILICGIELVILFLHFISSTGPKTNFPWKQYLFVSFIVPVIMIAVIGLIIVGFNFYMYGDKKQKPVDEDSISSSPKGKKMIQKSNYIFSILDQVPVLIEFAILFLGSLFFYNLDAIMGVIGLIGEKTAFYIFTSLACIVAGAFIFLLCWLFWKFRLNKIKLQNQSEFKKKVIETTGLIILDNNIVLDKNGKIVSDFNTPELLTAPQSKNIPKILPGISDKLDFK
jgi:hypothetical protein